MAAAETARLIASLELQDKNFTRGLKAAEKRLGNIDKRLGAASGALNRNLARGIDTVIDKSAELLVGTVKDATEFESAITGVAKTVSGDISGVTDELKKLSTEIPTSFVELAGIAELGGAMGVAKDDLVAFTEQVAILGATTNVSTEDAATSLGQLQNVIGLTGDEFDNFAASLVALGNAGASTEADILEIAKRAGASAKLFHIGKAETLGWASAVANLGLNAEAGGTALGSLFQKSLPLFLKGNKTIQKVTGKTAAELKRAFEKDAGAALQSFIADLGELSEGDRLAAIQKLYGKNSALTKILLGLTDDQGNLTDSVETGTKAWEEATAAQEEAEKRFKTSESMFKRLDNSVKIASATIGEALLPVLNELAQEGIAWLNEPATQKAIKSFAKDLGAGLRGLVSTLKGINWSGIADALGIAAGAAKTIVQAFLGMPSWVQAAVITGWGLNKVTGGLIGDLASGLIKGVLGINAGVVNINAGVVNGGGAPIPGGGKGGIFGGKGVFNSPLKIALGLTGVGLAAMLAEEFSDEISGLGSDLGFAWRDLLKTQLGISIPTIRIDQLEWPFGPKNTPTILPEIFGGNGLLGGTPSAPTGGGDRPSPGNPGLVRKELAELGVIKGAVNRRGAETKAAIDEQKAELGNIKVATDKNKSAINAAKGAVATAGRNTTTAATNAGIKAAGASRTAGQSVVGGLTLAANRIVTAVNSLDLAVNVTTVNRTRTVNNRYGPTSGSSTGNRTYSGQ